MMADLVGILNKIIIPTDHLNVALIQDILINTKAKKVSENDELLWSSTVDVLWNHLEKGLPIFDNQLLCATCFYTVLSLTKKQEFYLKQVQLTLSNEIISRKKNSNSAMKTASTSHVVSLMYGMFQSSFLTLKTTENIPNVIELLEVTVELLIIMSYEYSRYTFLVFKTINSFKKILGTKFHKHVYSLSNLEILLNLVNENWENPITGVRDLSKLIFKTVIGIIDKHLFEVVLKEINNFYWSKAKYLMLAEIVDQNGLIVSMQKKWIDGILYSLYKPGLVSAGTDMYFSIIKNLKSEEDWCNLFLTESVAILNGKSHKAIENFSNYWCLTTFKRFPNLIEILTYELLNIERSELNLFSSLCLFKQGAKLGQIRSKQESRLYTDMKKCVLQGIEHCNSHIRMLAFEIILVTQGKSMPSTSDFDLILNYLENNINSDSTVLRISMLNNLKCFLTLLQESVSIMCKDNDSDIEGVLEFYTKMQEIIINSIKIYGNYQRKLTTIKVCNILLSSFTDVPKKKQKDRKSNKSILNLLQEKQCVLIFEEHFIMMLFSHLKDPADDIREATIQLLLKHYSKEMTSVLMNNLMTDAQVCIKSKFFFHISCGQSIFRLISSLLVDGVYSETTFKSLEDIFSGILDDLCTEYEMKRGIVKSIEAGKQMHSLLGVMLEVLKVAKLNSCEIVMLNEKLPNIMDVLDGISNQFTWDEETSTSSDFSKISDMVQNMIISSGYRPTDKDFTKISGLQQIVLNCLWFNVKASCDVASFLIHFLKDEQIAECEKCLTIVMHVLEISRHKGVIEAAGAALGRAIQYLTSLPEENKLSNIPLSLLKSKIKELISYANTASITRRGAGLSIMVHRIVSSDMKKGKPLFHFFMESILDTCNSVEIPGNFNEDQRDLPKAIYIHFLTRIVIDSSLASDMMYYSVELAELAFDNLTSPHWQIRNAALQLYGALIPKLIGQKKASGTDDETVATVACDEFRTHSPKLWAHMKEGLQNIRTNEDTVQAHSNVMPILNVLANLAKKYSFAFDGADDLHDDELLQSLILLLDSPIFTVRRLSAKCIFNIFNFETIFRTVMEANIKSENFLHGCLLLVLNCHKFYSSHQYQQHFVQLKQKFQGILNTARHSYVCKQSFEELLGDELVMSNITEIMLESQHNRHTPGISHWAKSRLRKFIFDCAWDSIIEIVPVLSKERDFNEYCQILFMKIESQDPSNNEIKELAVKLLALENISNFSNVWKILYHISVRIDSRNLVSQNILEYIGNNEINYTMRYAIPYLASKAQCLQFEHQEIVSNTIFRLCDPEKSDVDLRHIAVIANNELAKAFSKVPDSIKISALKSAIILLQDEDEDVRNMSTYFYRHLSKSDGLLFPYVCLNRIFDYEFLEQFFVNPKKDIFTLCMQLHDVIDTYIKTDVDEYNPFASDSKNIYFEVEVVKKLLNKLKNSF